MPLFVTYPNMHVTSFFLMSCVFTLIKSFDMNDATLKGVFAKKKRPTSSRKHLTQFFAALGGGPCCCKDADLRNLSSYVVLDSDASNAHHDHNAL